ncbi:MAG: glycoside hydrolase family 32 protein, partial [Planctomycetota bacterium]
PGEDFACPDFFKLGNKHVLLGISHRVGARCYIGRFDKEEEEFFPERHVRMNWPGANFFAPESLIDHKGRRVFWGWVTDPRLRTTQLSAGSGVQSLPRVMSLDKDGTLLIKPVKELETLRRNHRRIENIELISDSEKVLEDIRGDCLELAIQIEPGIAQQVGLKVRCSPDGNEETVFFYDRVAKQLKMDMSRSTMRDDVAYPEVPQSPGSKNFRAVKGVIELVVAPFELKEGELLRFRVFLDKPMLEVFANDRQCLTQQVFPKRKDSLLIKVFAKGGAAVVRRVDAWGMAAAEFVDKRAP